MSCHITQMQASLNERDAYIYIYIYIYIIYIYIYYCAGFCVKIGFNFFSIKLIKETCNLIANSPSTVMDSEIGKMMFAFSMFSRCQQQTASTETLRKSSQQIRLTKT